MTDPKGTFRPRISPSAPPSERKRGGLPGFGGLGRMLRLFAVTTLVLVVACPSPESSGSEEAGAAEDSVTQRERYEALEDARVPGAGGLTGALDASDAAAAQAAARDSILRGQ